jgi:type III restriction enzyme
MPYSRNFFVLAPNTTIYEKLIDDFTPGKPKYVFKGIAEFAQNPPLIVTGDNWDEGRGLRRQGELLDADVIVNVFNVDKINRDVGRIRGPHDLIGSPPPATTQAGTARRSGRAATTPGPRKIT